MFTQRKSELYSPIYLKIPLSSSTINVSYVEMLDESSVEPWHVHACHEVYYCLENNMVLKAGNEQHKLDTGEFIMLMPGTPHNVVYSPGERKKYFVISFEIPQSCKNDEQNHPFLAKIYALSESEILCRGKCDLDKTTQVFDSMIRELAAMETGWLFLFRGYCLEFLMYCFRELIEPVEIPHREADNRNVAIEITKYMHSNYNQKITLNDIAEELYISPRHAQRIFKEFFGTSFAKTLNQYRMNYAKNYLISTNMSIEEIAEEVGLSSALPLYKLFREEEMMSISEYREKHRDITVS